MPKRKRDSLPILYTKFVVIDHIVEDEKSNNTLENLNVINPRKHIQKSNTSGRYNQSRHIQGKKIGETEWVDYTSVKGTSIVLNLAPANIIHVCQGKRHQTGGYVFRYKEDPDLPGEIWVNNTHAGVYVSNMGRVKRLTKNKGTLSNEYYSVRLNKKNHQVHRLVCQAFKWELVQQQFEQSKYTDIYSFWNSLQVDHIDKNKENNHIDNLRFLSREHYTWSNTKKTVKPQSRAILRKKDEKWILYSSVNQAARELKDISFSSILKCLKGKIINGYQFKYAPDPDLPGEIWKDVPQEFFKHSVKGWRVSNKGRVQFKQRVKTYGTQLGEYKRFGRCLVHRAVAAAFMQDQIMEVLQGQN